MNSYQNEWNTLDTTLFSRLKWNADISFFFIKYISFIIVQVRLINQSCPENIPLYACISAGESSCWYQSSCKNGAQSWSWHWLRVSVKILPQFIVKGLKARYWFPQKRQALVLGAIKQVLLHSMNGYQVFHQTY